MESAQKLVTEYLKKFHFYPNFTFDEFKHYFASQDHIIYVYVIVVIRFAVFTEANLLIVE